MLMNPAASNHFLILELHGWIKGRPFAAAPCCIISMHCCSAVFSIVPSSAVQRPNSWISRNPPGCKLLARKMRRLAILRGYFDFQNRSWTRTAVVGVVQKDYSLVALFEVLRKEEIVSWLFSESSETSSNQGPHLGPILDARIQEPAMNIVELVVIELPGIFYIIDKELHVWWHTGYRLASDDLSFEPWIAHKLGWIGLRSLPMTCESGNSSAVSIAQIPAFQLVRVKLAREIEQTSATYLCRCRHRVRAWAVVQLR